MKFVKQLTETKQGDIGIAGGKGANLGELVKMGMPVPDGFIVSSQAFEKFLKETDIDVEIQAALDRINLEDIESVEENSEILRNLILEKEVPEDLTRKILKAFNRLGAKFVAVRSSATAEDSKIDSWAGELETYLNTTKENLLENIKKCWASLFTPRAISYRFRKKLGQKPISVAIVVQKMIQSDVSGVCFTVHPVTKDENQMIIESCWGLGEALVSGMVTPDSYVIEKSKVNDEDAKFILDKNISLQEKMVVQAGNGTKVVAVSQSRREKQKLSVEQIKELAKLCLKIENHFKAPQDIEWALEKNKFFILQARPITTL